MMRQVLKRYEGIRSSSPRTCPTPARPSTTRAWRVQGQYLLLLRCGRLNGMSEFGLALSDDGYHFKIHPEPVMKRPRKDLQSPRTRASRTRASRRWATRTTSSTAVTRPAAPDGPGEDQGLPEDRAHGPDHRDRLPQLRAVPGEDRRMYVRFERPNWGRPASGSATRPT